MRTSLITQPTTPAVRRPKVTKKAQKPKTPPRAADITSRQRSEIMFALIDARGAALNMRQLSEATGIERPTICRRLDELVRAGRAAFSHKADCPISGYPNVKFFRKTQ